MTLISVCVKMMSGTTASVAVERTSTVLEFKETVEAQEGIPVKRQRLLGAGSSEMRDCQTLAELGVEDDSTLHLLVLPEPTVVVPTSSEAVGLSSSEVTDIERTQSYNDFAATFPHLTLAKPSEEAPSNFARLRPSPLLMDASESPPCNEPEQPAAVVDDAAGARAAAGDGTGVDAVALTGEVAAGRLAYTGAKSPRIQVGNFVDEEDSEDELSEDELCEETKTGGLEAKTGSSSASSDAPPSHGVLATGCWGDAPVEQDVDDDAVSTFEVDKDFDYDNVVLTDRFEDYGIEMPRPNLTTAPPPPREMVLHVE